MKSDFFALGQGLFVVAARPSNGKYAVVERLIRNVTDAGKVVSVFGDGLRMFLWGHLNAEDSRHVKLKGGSDCIDFIMRESLRPKNLGMIVVEEGKCKIDTCSVNALKKFSNKYNIPVLVVSGVSRHVEYMNNHCPHLNDVKSPAANLADAVFLLYRDEYYDRYSSMKGKIEVSRVQKNGEVSKNVMGYDYLNDTIIGNDWILTE